MSFQNRVLITKAIKLTNLIKPVTIKIAKKSRRTI
jgi:hypothetical protein